MTTLSSVSTRIRGNPGGTGQGTWQNGKAGAPTIIRVPVGTIVRQLAQDDPKRAQDEYEAEEESLQGLSIEERKKKIREDGLEKCAYRIVRREVLIVISPLEYY